MHKLTKVELPFIFILLFGLYNKPANSILSENTPKNYQITPIYDEKNISNKDFEKLNLRMENSKKNLQLFLKGQNKKNIIGYGASTKGNIVLNHLKLSSKNLSFICDANPFKFNRYTPGSNIKIISKKEMRKRNPKYLLVLIWSFRSEVIKQEQKYIEKGGNLVFHLPL